MPSPKISVIVPVYNAEKWLHRCVDSILAQTYTDFELLLIDDGSTDGSGAICDEYATSDSRVRVFHKPNGGVSSARNLGLDNALGEWITFADADDYVYPNWLDNFSPNDENYDIKCQGVRTNKPIAQDKKFEHQLEYSIDCEGNVLTLLDSLSENAILGYLFLKIFRHSIISHNQIRFDLKIRLCEDELFVMQYAQYARNGRSISDIGYFYFVPDWDNKYKIDFEEKEYLLRQQLLYCHTKYPQTNSKIYKQLYCALQFLYLTEAIKKISVRRYCIQNLRSLLIQDFKTSYFTTKTKIILRYDITGLFSSLYLILLNRRNNACH